MFRTTLLIALLFAVASGAHAGAPPELDVPFNVIVEPEPGTLDEVYDLVIRDSDRWRQFWERLHPETPVPPIDFAERMVAVVSMGTPPFGGTDILVPRVTRSLGNGIRSLLVTIHVTEVRPGKACVIFEPFRTTYKLVDMGRSSDVTLRRRTVYRSCR